MKKNYLYILLRPLITFIFKAYYNPIIIGKENIPKKNKAVIAGNHKHNFDAIFVGCSTKRNIYCLAKKELFDSIFGFFFKEVGCIPVDRTKKNDESMKTAINYLNNENLIFIAPEGTRNKTNKILLDFKYGAVVIAKKSNSSIIPYAITGDYRFRSKNLKIIFGKKLDISKLSIEEANKLLYKTVEELIINSESSVK